MSISLREINEVIASWDSISDSKKLETIKDLKKIGTLTPIDPVQPSGFNCPIQFFSINQPCSLKECSYNMQATTGYNCLYHYLDDSKRGRMTVNEISACFNISIVKVNSINNDSFVKIKKQYLKEQIEENLTTKFKYLGGHCVNCGTYIQPELDLNNDSSLTIEYGKYGWCSSDCKKAKPNWMFRIEHYYNTTFANIFEYANKLAELYNKNTNKEVEMLLDLPPGVVSTYKKKVCKHNSDVEVENRNTKVIYKANIVDTRQDGSIIFSIDSPKYDGLEFDTLYDVEWKVVK